MLRVQTLEASGWFWDFGNILYYGCATRLGGEFSRVARLAVINTEIFGRNPRTRKYNGILIIWGFFLFLFFAFCFPLFFCFPRLLCFSAFLLLFSASLASLLFCFSASLLLLL